MATKNIKSKSALTNKKVVKAPAAKKKMAIKKGPSSKPATHQKSTTIKKPSMTSIDPNKTSTLDIGSGAAPRNSFNTEQIVGVDLRAAENVLALDLVTDALPFADNSFDYVTAFDVLQTIPRLIYNPHRRMPFVDLMSEVFRVLKPGGLFLSVTPVYPKEATFRDPSHVNHITAETFGLYFDQGNNWASGYGFKGGFFVESQEWSGEHHLVTNLRKPAA